MYYDYLNYNYNTLNESLKSRVELKKCFIGTGNYSGDLIHEHGTADILLNNFKKINFTTLTSLLQLENKKITLIKVDTDGFDFDVLISGEEILRKHKPILYWENLIDHDFQIKGFKNLYQLLTRINYKFIYIFDNFGNLITFTNSFSILEEINEYLYSQLKSDCTRTFHYTDILASTEENEIIIKNSIKNYKKFINNIF